MSADLETILIYLQRRYNILREVCSLTEELAEAVERGDTVSASLLLDMRGEQLQRHADCEEQIILQTAVNAIDFCKEVGCTDLLFAISLTSCSTPSKVDCLNNIRIQ